MPLTSVGLQKSSSKTPDIKKLAFANLAKQYLKGLPVVLNMSRDSNKKTDIFPHP